MPTLLTANAKIRKSGKKHGIALYNFGIPAFKSKTGLVTCPAAGTCAIGCYAQQGAYVFGNVAPVFEWRLSVTQDAGLFLSLMTEELTEAIRKADKRKMQVMIRIHDSGDFYSVQYWRLWETVMKRFPTVKFYAYTKQVRLFKRIELPANFRLIFSEGGLFDREVDETRHHARVFPTLEALQAAGYANASEDDLVAGLGANPKIGLVYHGAASKEWTTNEKDFAKVS